MTYPHEYLTLTGHRNEVFAVAVAPDGSLLASASRDRTIRLWSMPDGHECAVRDAHRGEGRGEQNRECRQREVAHGFLLDRGRRRERRRKRDERHLAQAECQVLGLLLRPMEATQVSWHSG